MSLTLEDISEEYFPGGFADTQAYGDPESWSRDTDKDKGRAVG
jgi:hypothetical protein